MADSVDLQKLVEIVSNIWPIGSIIDYAGDVTKIPEHWELCDGQFSDTLGKNRPDMRGRVAIGYGAFVESGTTYSYEVGQTGGEAKHQLSEDELAKHSHISGVYSASSTNQSVYGVATVKAGERKEGGASSTTSPYTSEEGGNDAHENRQPYYVTAKIIRVSNPTI